MNKNLSRKEFIRNTAIAGAGLTVMPYSLLKDKDNHAVNIGIIGVGGRGTGHLRGLLRRSDVNIPAICDIREAHANRAKNLITDAGWDAPELYTKGEYDYERMLQRDDLDGVIIATPWLWHTPIAVETMKSGKYAGVEVPGPITLDGCWKMVETSESTGLPCMILENSCYRRRVLAILNMVRQGIFGEMIHARCGYFHNLLSVLLDHNGNFGPDTEGESVWRTYHHVRRNGMLYPNHGVGPVAHWLDINRGNRFQSLTASATKARGLHNKIVKRAGKDSANADVEFKTGDVVTCTITTANGETIIVTLNTTLPRPKTMGYWCQGTKGIWMVNNDHINKDVSINSIYIEGMSPEYDQWEPFDKYLEEYESVLWKKNGKLAANAEHGGDGFFIRNAFIESIKRKTTPPMDVYDAAAWGAIGPLSEESIAQGGGAVEFPDFTDGKWMTNKRIFNPEEKGY